MYRTLIFGMAAALMLAGKVSAQSTLPAGDDMSTGTFTGATQTGLPGLYDQLSSGNQKSPKPFSKPSRAAARPRPGRSKTSPWSNGKAPDGATFSGG